MSEVNPTNMIQFKNRMQTFENWIYNNQNVKCTSEQMAKAGFYLLSNDRDSTKCFVCMKTLNDWEANDDPFEEHKKHSPQCPFVKLNKIEDDMTLLEIIGLVKVMYINLGTEYFNDQKKKIQEKHDQMISELKDRERQKKRFRGTGTNF